MQTNLFMFCPSKKPKWGYEFLCIMFGLLASVTGMAQAPVISSISPAKGPVGAIITLSGTNFNPVASNNIVYFGSNRAIVNTASATSLTVTVPVGAVHHPVSVLNTTTHLTGYSSQYFFPTFTSKPQLDSADFDDPAILGVVTDNRCVVPADIDGDGKPDLIVPNTNRSFVSIFRNTSDSGSITAASFAPRVDFLSQVYLPSGGGGSHTLRVIDLDGDGKLDLVIAQFAMSGFSILRNISTPGTIAFENYVTIPSGALPMDLAVGDLDGDGRPDIAVINVLSYNISVFRNMATPGSLTASSFAAKMDFAIGGNIQPRSINLGDMDGDKKLDMVVTNTINSDFYVYRNTATAGTIIASSFAAKSTFSTGGIAAMGNLGDLDGDGKLDVIIANSNDNRLSVHRNISTSGNISFAERLQLATGQFPVSIGIGDLNGDGKPDLAVPNRSSSSISIFRNTSVSGTISLDPKSDLPTTEGPFWVSIGDIDGDNRPDLSVASWAIHYSVSVFRNNPYVPAPAAPVASNIDVSDFDISWGAVADAQSYQLDVSLSPDFYDFIPGYSNVTVQDTMQHLSGLTENTTYYFRVRAINTGVISASSPGSQKTKSTNVAPVITSYEGAPSVIIQVPENSTTTATITATDANEGTHLVYSLENGGDAGSFSIHPATGQLDFITPPDFELPGDANSDNVYIVTVRVSDGSLTATQRFKIEITDANDHTPVITSYDGEFSVTLRVAENTTAAIGRATATDVDKNTTIAYSIVEEEDGAKFTINPSTGELKFITAPDFDQPADNNGDNVYIVTVKASDGMFSATQRFKIKITDENDNAPAFSSHNGNAVVNLELPENVQFVTTVAAADADGTPVTYSIVSENDGALFSVNPAGKLNFVTPPDFEHPADGNHDNIYKVSVKASDGSLSAVQQFIITITDLNDNPPTATMTIRVPENTVEVTPLEGTDDDAGSSVVFIMMDKEDGALFWINPANGSLEFKTAPDFESPADADHDNIYLVSVKMTAGEIITILRFKVKVTGAGAGTGRMTNRSTPETEIQSTVVLQIEAGPEIKPGESINIYPNPVTGKRFTLRMDNISTGKYTLEVYTTAGQLVCRQQLNHTGKSVLYPVQLPASLTRATYILKVTGADTRYTEKLIIE